MERALPPGLVAALEALAEGHGLAGLRGKAAAMSEAYRARQGTGAVIRDPEAALAYALARMPATFAAVSAALEQVIDVLPGFRPASLLDAGSGPGTAAFAVAATLGPLQRAVLVDQNEALLALAGQLGETVADLVGRVEIQQASLDGLRPPPAAADLVTASYVLSELPEERALSALDSLWAAASEALLLIEPGTPAGFATVRRARERLVGAGARIAAPCPHDLACPMAGGDWCHFKTRLPRLKLHKALKSADLGYEDEPFAFVAAVKSLVPRRPVSRVIAPPDPSKAGIGLRLCRDGRVDGQMIARRDRMAFAAARRLRWGDGREA